MPVPQLTLALQPGFVDEDGAAFNAGNAAAAAALKQVNDNAKYAAVRFETFWGYYKNGETVALPQSDADGYQYSREELHYSWSRVWSGAATGALNGTQTLPQFGATSGDGTVLQWSDVVDQATGAVTCRTDYFKSAHTVTTNGIVLVIVHALRNR